MSNVQNNADSKFCFASTAIAAIGGFAIFLIILAVAYLPNRTPPPGDGVKTPKERKDLLVELRGKEHTAASGYAWIDKEKGIVRLPIDRAVELTINDFKK